MQEFLELLKSLEDSQLGLWIAESEWAFPALEIVHIFAIAMVFGTIAVIDLRLLGFASTNRRYSEMARELLPWTWGAWFTAAACGTLLFISRPVEYFENTELRLKFLLMGLAGVNMLVFQFVTARDIGRWDAGAPPLAGKIAGGVSLVLWIGVVFFARRIGYTLVQGGV